jgi:dihydroorotase
LEIFRLPANEDYVLIDLKKKKMIKDSNIKSKCGWSPYAGLELQGWPVYTILKGKVYDLS